MGVEYRHFVIPATCGLIPSPARVCNLVQKMVEGGWLTDAPGELETPGKEETVEGFLDENQYVALMASDFRLSWQMEWPSARDFLYAFSSQSDDNAYYTVQICHSPQFLVPLSELIDPLQDPLGSEEPKPEGLLSKVKELFNPRAQLLDLAIRCDCGAALEDRSEVFDTYDILLARCPACGKAFRPEERRGKLRNGWTSGVNRRPGGLVHRFAVVFDCGKSLPNRNGPGVLAPDLSELISTCVGTSLFEFGDLY